mgnify:FL=1|tara:strand:- start:7256 stop:8242 length:987 start_codon:yes stop_codon:yes gene_type:complete
MRKAKFVYLLVGIGLLIWVLGDIDVSAALARVAEIGALGIAAILFVYFLSFLGDSISWSLIITSVPISLTWFRRTFVVRLAGEAFNNIIPAGGFAGEPVKAVILKRRYGVDYKEATASIVMARTINMIALIVFLCVGFVFILQADSLDGPLKIAASIGLGVLSLGTVLLYAVQRFRASSWVLSRFGTTGWAAKVAGALVVAEDMDHRFVTFYTAHRRRLLASLILAFLNWALGAVEIYLTFVFLDAPVSWAEAWMIEALAQMVRSAMFFIPLAVGAQEGVFVLTITAITGVPSLGLACAVVRRIRELIFIAFGLAAAALYPVSLKDQT